MLNTSDFEMYIARFVKLFSSPSREILLTLSVIAVTMNSISLAALGRLTRPLTTFQINLVNLAVSDLILAVTKTVAICVNIYMQTMIPPSKNHRESEDGFSVLHETINLTENATSTAFGEDATAHNSNEKVSFGLMNLACCERFIVVLTIYFTLLPLMATTSLVYHQLTTLWHPLDFTKKYNKKPTAVFVILSFLIPAVSFSLGIIFNYVKESQDGCLTMLTSRSVTLAVSGTVSITIAIAFVGNTVMLALLLYKARKQIINGPLKNMAKKAFKASQTIAMLWATLFVLWSAGLVALTIVFSFSLISSSIPESFGIVNVVSVQLYTLNSFVDPIIYGLRIPEVREAYTRILSFNNQQKCNINELPIYQVTLGNKSVESQGTRKPNDYYEEAKF